MDEKPIDRPRAPIALRDRAATSRRPRRLFAIALPVVASTVASTLLLFGCGGSGSSGTSADASGVASGAGGAATAPVEIKAVQIASGLVNPWSLAFLPDGRMLVTEKAGTMRFVSSDGRLSNSITGVPAVRSSGQGGLLDVVPGPNFAADRTIYFSYSEPVGAGDARTAVARAVLGETTLSDVRVIFRQTPALSSTIHFGSRLVFDRSGYLFVTLGERGFGDAAQRLESTQGKVVRITVDGAIPPDNPAFIATAPAPGVPADEGPAHPAFAQAGVLAENWTFGHRNPQGAALHPVTGELWVGEHGPRGGDEINRIRRGRNYGWPRITRGLDYTTGLPLGDGTTAADVEPSKHDWVGVSVAPAGLLFYTGDKLPGWQGSLMVGTLAGQALIRLSLQGDSVTGETRHLQSLQQRFRDIRQGPDGYPYVLTDNGGLYRIERQ